MENDGDVDGKPLSDVSALGRIVRQLHDGQSHGDEVNVAPRAETSIGRIHVLRGSCTWRRQLHPP